MVHDTIDRRTVIRNVGVMAGGLSLVGVVSGQEDDEAEPGEPVQAFEFASYTVEEDPVRYETAVLATEMWNELGFEVEHNPTEIGALLDMTFDEKEHEVMGVRMGGQPQRMDPDHFLYNGFHSQFHDEPGSYNISWYQSEEFDEVVEEQRRIPDPDERQELVYECQEILARDVAEIFLFEQYEVQPLNTERFTNWDDSMPGAGLWDIWNLHQIEPADDDVTTFRYGYPGGDVQTMNPWEPFPTQDVLQLNLIYDKLVQITPEGEYEPWAVSEVERVDGETIDLELREGMQWHDGEDVTVDDLIFTFEYGMEHGGGPAYGDVEDVEEGGDLDVRIHLADEIATFEIMGLGMIYLTPQHVWEDVDDPFDVEDIDRTASGLFEFDYWNPDEEMRLERFDEHWDPANLEELIWVPASGISPLFRALIAEDLDMIAWTLTLDQIPEAEEQPFLDTFEIGDMAHHVIALNHRYEPFDDLEVRRALATATPTPDIMEVTLGGTREAGGYADPIYGPITPSVEFWHNPDISEEYRYEFDMEEARAILEDAGYTWNDGRIHYPE